MLDIGLFRRVPEGVRRSAARKGDASFVDRVLALDAERRAALTDVERLRAEKNALTQRISHAEDRAAEAARLRPEIAALDQRIEQASGRAPEIEERLNELLADVPNLPDPSIPDGAGADNNIEVRRWGSHPAFDFAPKPHWEIGEALGVLDFERAAKLSGSRFTLLSGQGARLSRAIVNFFLDLAGSAGYTEVAPPFLVSRKTMWATGQLSKFADAMFTDTERDMFLIPTAEVPLTALRSEEILPAEQLPLAYTAYSPCFRKEAGAAGKDTRGMMRLHQFEKVELVRLCTPEQGLDNLERLTSDAESLLRALELPHRVVLLCAGDTGFNSAKTYDLEVWIPSQETYREISSCSLCTDFQARRANIRFRRDPKSRPEFVYTLNGSGLAVGRTLLAILENFQQADGSVRIPDALVPYAGFDRIAADALVTR
ncbi:MAG: serine--tRNA ligase [Vulcanimicrobiaceae bacterium]